MTDPNPQQTVREKLNHSLSVLQLQSIENHIDFPYIDAPDERLLEKTFDQILALIEQEVAAARIDELRMTKMYYPEYATKETTIMLSLLNNRLKELEKTDV